MNERDSEVIINANSGAGKVGFTNLSFYCTIKFGLGGLNENLVFEAPANNIRAMTKFLRQIATQIGQNYDFNCYERNKNEMFSPGKVAAKIIEMISVAI